MINVPYSELELSLAIYSLEKKINLEDEKIAHEIISISSKYDFLKKEADFNKHIAESLGITVLDLINSPNYTILKDKFEKEVYLDFFKELEKKYGLTEKEFWAMAYYASKA